MATIRQYRPAYFSGFEQEIIDFNSNEELLSIEFVKNFTTEKSFIRFLIYDYAYDKTSESRYLIMAEYSGKKENERWGVGFFDSIECLNLEKSIDFWNEEVYLIRQGT